MATIFGDKRDESVEVPEIEIHGDEASIPMHEDDGPPDRKVKLPKTKWYC